MAKICPKLMTGNGRDIKVILILNPGSSTIKFALYSLKKSLNVLYRGKVADIGGAAKVTIYNADNTVIYSAAVKVADHRAAFSLVFKHSLQLESDKTIAAVGHRVVHGGHIFDGAVVIDDDVIRDIASLQPLATLHQQNSLLAIELVEQTWPGTRQIACFDTAFHHSMPKVEQQVAIDKELVTEEVRRYGFHGLSYQYIAQQLPHYMGKKLADSRVIVAHLGNGASLCAMTNRQSRATTMSFSPLDGLTMGTRCGSIDPGLLLYLQQHKNICLEKLSDSLNYQSGLKALSGGSSDMQTLLASSRTEDKNAVEHFVYQLTKHIGAMAAAIAGVDAIVFTGGIGENSALLRQQVCQQMSWLGLELDKAANQACHPLISKKGSKVTVWAIPTNEERYIAEQVTNLLVDDVSMKLA